MDPLSVTASVIAVIQITGDLIEYIRSASDANKEQRHLAREAVSAYQVLLGLQFQIQESKGDEEWFRTVRRLAEPEGVLDEYRHALEELAPLAKERTGFASKVSGALRWHFTEKNVKRALDCIHRLQETANLALSNDIFTLARKLNNDMRNANKKLDDAEKQTIADWLAPDDQTAVHADRISKAEFDTGQWFLDATEQWRCGDKRRLFCLGMPGAGKTILASQLISNIQETLLTDGKRLGYFYMNYKEQQTQTADNIYRSLLRQFLQQSDKISPDIRFLWTYWKERGIFPDRKLLQRTVLKELRSSEETWIIVDAADECRDDDHTLTHLLHMLRQSPKSVRWLITAREIPSILDRVSEGDLEEASPLTVAANEGDVRRYVQGRIEAESKFQKLIKRDPSLKQKVIEKVSQSVQGMFLLAVLHLDSLLTKTNPAAVVKTINSLPRGIEGAYDQAMERIRAQGVEERERAELTLMWAVYSHRPLHIHEFNHALTIRSGAATIEEDEVEEGEMFVSECAGLVIVEKGSQLVRLVHETAQDYFGKPRDQPILPGALEAVAKACLSYLRLDNMADNFPSALALAERVDEYPFLRYAARYWGHHVASNISDKAINDSAMGLITDPQRLATSVQVLSLPDQPDLTTLNLEDYRKPQYELSVHHVYLDAPALCVVAYFGLTSIAARLLSIGSDAVKARCSYGRTPLHYATANGHLNMVNLLVEKGSDLNAQDKDGVTPLHLAAERDGARADIVEALLNAGTTTEARTTTLNQWSDWSLTTPLHWATSRGNVEITQMLLDKGAKIEAFNAWRRTPLHLSTRQNRLEVMELLISRGANIEAERDGRGTPVIWAAENGHLDAAKLLLRHNAKAMVASYQGTPIELAMMYNHSTLVDFFMDMDRRRGGSEDIIRYTMRSAMNRSGHADHGRRTFLKLLEAFPGSLRDEIIAEEFANAFKVNMFDSAKWLMSQGAATGHEDHFGRTMAHMSLRYDRFDYFELCMQNGVDHTKIDLQGCSLAHHSAAGNCVKGFDWLLDKSMDVNCQDNNDWSPLHYAALQGNHETADYLLANGSRTDIRDLQGRTPLDIAREIRPGDLALLQKLGASAEEAQSISSSAQYTPEEDTFYFMACGNLQLAREVLKNGLTKPFDLQWDWNWSKMVHNFCDAPKGECPNERWAQLWSPSNEIIYRAAFQRIMQRANRIEDGKMRVSLSRHLSRPTFCECCGYLTIRRRYKCKCGKISLCLRCEVDSEKFFPGHTFAKPNN